MPQPPQQPRREEAVEVTSEKQRTCLTVLTCAADSVGFISLIASTLQPACFLSLGQKGFVKRLQRELKLGIELSMHRGPASLSGQLAASGVTGTPPHWRERVRRLRSSRSRSIAGLR